MPTRLLQLSLSQPQVDCITAHIRSSTAAQPSVAFPTSQSSPLVRNRAANSTATAQHVQQPYSPLPHASTERYAGDEVVSKLRQALEIEVNAPRGFLCMCQANTGQQVALRRSVEAKAVEMEDTLRLCVEQLQEANKVGSMWRSKCISQEQQSAAMQQQSAARIAALEQVVKSLQGAAAGSADSRKRDVAQLR